ncbi:hypothetical protein [uncultured Pontibacter sp.]|uniref:hypothetical protein n=1 Tax=uncultured Pontibacter sp. TaxID=453356 RepID=UPI00261C4FB7|nr:hypothetical protein [uncultured Pontibacter sp.]
MDNPLFEQAKMLKGYIKELSFITYDGQRLDTNGITYEVDEVKGKIDFNIGDDKNTGIEIFPMLNGRQLSIRSFEGKNCNVYKNEVNSIQIDTFKEKVDSVVLDDE